MIAVVSVSAPRPLRRASREQRERRFFGFAGSQWPQSPSARGTPPDEPQPRIVNSSTPLTVAVSGRTGRRRQPRSWPPPRPGSSRGSPPAWPGHGARRPARCGGPDRARAQGMGSPVSTMMPISPGMSRITTHAHASSAAALKVAIPETDEPGSQAPPPCAASSARPRCQCSPGCESGPAGMFLFQDVAHRRRPPRTRVCTTRGGGGGGRPVAARRGQCGRRRTPEPGCRAGSGRSGNRGRSRRCRQRASRRRTDQGLPWPTESSASFASMRVGAYRAPDVGLVGERADLLPVRDLVGDIDHQPHAGGPCAGVFLVAAGVELGVRCRLTWLSISIWRLTRPGPPGAVRPGP